jgi:hypothetical protein
MKDFNGIYTPGVEFSKICPTPDMAGNQVAVSNGLDINGGQKGTPGIMPEVTTVSVTGATSPGLNQPSGIASPRPSAMPKF